MSIDECVENVDAKVQPGPQVQVDTLSFFSVFLFVVLQDDAAG
jgi:hypothetical protein